MLRKRLTDPDPVVTTPTRYMSTRYKNTAPPVWVNSMIALLCETYPKTFFLYERRRVPLKLGIRNDIMRAMGSGIDPAQASAAVGWALRMYCSNSFYLDKIRTGAKRIDLDGKEVGCVSAEQAKGATALVAARRAKRRAKAKAKVAGEHADAAT